MVALISLLSALERPWPTVNFCGLETNDHCDIIYRLCYYGINTNNKYHGRESASIYTRSCHLAYLRASSSRKKLIYRTTTAAIYACRRRRVFWLKLWQANWFTRIYLEPVEPVVGGQQLAGFAFGLCQAARLCSSSSISPLRLDVPLPRRGSVPSLRMQFAPGCNQCRSRWKFRGWRSRRRRADRAELGQARHQLRSTPGQVRFVLLRKTKAHLYLISRLFLPLPLPLFPFVSFIVLFRSHPFPSISIAPLCSDVLQLSFSFPQFLAASNLGVYFERRSYLRNRVLSFSLLASVSVRS